MTTPCERMLLSEYAAARRDFAECRPERDPGGTFTIYSDPARRTVEDPNTRAWLVNLRTRELRVEMALEDIRAHVAEHGEIETDRGFWAIDGDGRPVYRIVPEWEALAC